MGRRKSGGMKFWPPLATKDSKVVYHCYASHGKGYGKNPPWGAEIRILCINEQREVKWVDGRFATGAAEYECDEMRGMRRVRAGRVLVGIWSTARCRTENSTSSILSLRSSAIYQ
jgi:hypothetical protein